MKELRTSKPGALRVLLADEGPQPFMTFYDTYLGELKAERLLDETES